MPKTTPMYGKGKEWTIMIYCAGDNELAPLIVSQLKGIKDAGRHQDANVLVYVDPNEKGAPTRLYCIDQSAVRLQRSARDAYVRNMRDDAIEINGRARGATKELKNALRRADKIEAKRALKLFLRFCRENYRAKHYALVLMGHGMIVANDAFLPDESPLSAITLKELGDMLGGFGQRLELLALHSCSMSAIEVAYELKGKANYMMASEGLSFVGGWPYRQLLTRTFNLLEETRNHNGRARQAYLGFDVQNLIEKLYYLSYYNGFDFMLSGYSQDLALINLNPENYESLSKALQNLVGELKNGLRDRSGLPKQLIQLAHLESQSYFNENYTDLYDFCHCLAENCNNRGGGLGRLKAACNKVMEELEPKKSDDRKERFSKIVIHSKHFGSHYQYSHGLSIYFPWSQPLGDPKDSVLKKYEDYEFNSALGKRDTWLSFLELYLKKTERKRRTDITTPPATKKMFGVGLLSNPNTEHKPTGGSGPACTCPSIKNFPTEERVIKGKRKRMEKFAMARRVKGEGQ